jgi:hypothetical protein
MVRQSKVFDAVQEHEDRAENVCYTYSGGTYSSKHSHSQFSELDTVAGFTIWTFLTGIAWVSSAVGLE